MVRCPTMLWSLTSRTFGGLLYEFYQYNRMYTMLWWKLGRSHSSRSANDHITTMLGHFFLNWKRIYLYLFPEWWISYILMLCFCRSSGEAGLGCIQLTLRYSIQRQRLVVVVHKVVYVNIFQLVSIIMTVSPSKGKEFSLYQYIQTSSDPPVPSLVGTGSLSTGQNGWSMKLITHLHPLLRIRMFRALPHLSHKLWCLSTGTALFITFCQ
jgi:hypothetical protein